jgi:hypothetical protein
MDHFDYIQKNIMSDGSKVFADLKKSLKKAFPKMSGHEGAHFGTLLHMVSGMIVSKHCHLPKIAGKIKSTIKQESIIVKLKRWLNNKSVNYKLFFLGMQFTPLARYSMQLSPLAVNSRQQFSRDWIDFKRLLNQPIKQLSS